MLLESLAAALICLDPGHATAPEWARRREPIGPGARELKVVDGGGTAGEAPAHADGSLDPSRHGVSTLVPALRRGWTDDVYAASLRAGRLAQRELVRATGARDLGVVERADLTGFNWSDVPTILVETGFLTNPRERSLLATPRYRERVAVALAAAARSFTRR